ncbi:MAG TPA: hypothetical protein VGD41_18955 [Pyrinomonadaceae bacterium]
MKLNSFSLGLLVVMVLTTSLVVRPQQRSFTVSSIRPYDKAVPGQVMEVLIEGITPGTAPVILPASDFSVDVSQDGVTQSAKVRITKFSMIRESNPNGPNRSADAKLSVYHAVGFVVPKGLHPGPAEVIASYKGQRGNAIGLEIVEKPLAPVLGGTAVMAVSGQAPERAPEVLQKNDLGWRFERGTTAIVFVNPLVDPDDPNAAVLIRFKQGEQDYEAVTRITSTAGRVENSERRVSFLPPREDLQVDVPAALTLGPAQVEIRLKANGQLSDPVNVTAMITDVTRGAEPPKVSAPRVLSATPSRVGAGQSLVISVDHKRTLDPSPKETRVVIEQDNARYFATIEQNTALFGPGQEPDAPVGLFVRTTRQLIGRVQVRVLNPLRGEQVGLSEPVPLEIVDEVFAPELTSVAEATATDLLRLRQMYEIQKKAGREFPEYDPDSRYLMIKVRGVDFNPNYIRITLEQGGEKYTLSFADFSSYSSDGLIVRLPDELTGGNVKFTIENSGGDRYSKPATKSFVLASRP